MRPEDPELRRIFGTDGVRGVANAQPMTPDMVLKIGAAAGRYFRRESHGVHRVVIGKDTRLSGYMFENALAAGLTSTGMNVLLMGPVPTPAVGLLTRSLRADLGVMISASHNPAVDNGIKFFGPDGLKLSNRAEAEIEQMIVSGVSPCPATEIGIAKRIDDARFRYGERIKHSLPRSMRLEGLRIVIDCAHGAAYRVGPEILWELGAEVIPLGVAPNGLNINADCGSTHPRAAQAAVLSHSADVGICLDGDADRVVLIDEMGQLADGDQIMALIATRMAEAGQLHGNTLVATVMSNLGLEKYLAERNLRLERTDVGDRYVMERMLSEGYTLGGEQSGHIIMSEHSTTGDGLLASLQVLAALVQTEEPVSRLLRRFEPVPQLWRNIRYQAGNNPLEQTGVKSAINATEADLGDRGRLVVRKSGTESVIRIMAESPDTKLLKASVERVVAALQTDER